MAITIKATTGTPASTGYMVYTDGATGTFKKALFSALPISDAAQAAIDDLQDQIDNIPGGSSSPGTVITFTAAVPFTRANTIMNKALTADLVLTENMTGQLDGAGGTIRIIQDTTPRTVTFPAGWVELAGSEGISTTAGMVHQVLYYRNIIGGEVSYSISQLGVSTANFAPSADNVAISGTIQEGETLTGSYDYNDVNGDTEGTSLKQWYRADSNIGSGRAAISGATASTYDLQAADVGKYIQFGVTPVATTGVTPGTEGVSAYTTIVIAAGGNQAPVASAVAISGTAKVGQTLTGSYNYSDNESDAEGTSLKQWYRADNNSGLNRAAISGATASTYLLVSGDLGKFIQYQVTPIAATGTTTGSAAVSSYTTAVLENVAPTVVSRVATGPNTIVVNYSEIVNAASSTGNSFNNGGALTISGMTGTGTTALTFTITQTMTSGDTITHTYTGTVVKDVALNNLAAFTNQAVTNSIGAGSFLTFTTQTGSITGGSAGSPTGTFSGAAGQYMVSDQQAAADCFVDAVIPAGGSSTNEILILGLDDTATHNDYTGTWELYVFPYLGNYYTSSSATAYALHDTGVAYATGHHWGLVRASGSIHARYSTDGGTTYTNLEVSPILTGVSGTLNAKVSFAIGTTTITELKGGGFA